MRAHRPRVAFLAVLVSALTATPALADFPYSKAGSDEADYSNLYLGAGNVPADLSEKETWMYSATPEDPGIPPDPGTVAVNANPAELFGVRGGHIADDAASVDTAWQVTTGRPDVKIAVLDSGIKWNDLGAMQNLRFKTVLNPGEAKMPRNDGLATPNEPGQDCSAAGPYDGPAPDGPSHDLNGDGVFNVLDYSCDRRVLVNTPKGVGPADLLEPQDVLIAFTNGTDSDGNGYEDDIVGWDFLDDDNDPFDDVQYGHGTGEANDSVAEADNTQGGAGTCPNCMALHMRVGDSFIADVNRFAAAVTYATDNGALVIQEALGTVNNTSLARDSVEYAYRHGVTVIASAADEAAQHNNWPSSLPHVILVNSVTQYSEFAEAPDPLPSPLTEQPKSYLKFNGCTNFNAKITVAIPSVSCSSDATGRGAGIAGLIHSAALNAVERGKLKPHPGCEQVNGEPCAVTPNEVRQLMASGTLSGTPLSDDVDFSQDPEPSCTVTPVPTCTDPFLGRGTEIPALLPVVTLIPSSKRYPARGGHDQFYGWGRVNVSRGVNALVPRPFNDASVKSKVPPEVEITSPEWFDQVDPEKPTRSVKGEVYARGRPYTCQVLVAPGHYPNNRSTAQTPPGDFKPVVSDQCNGSVRTDSFDGTLAQLDLADLRSRFPSSAGTFDGREPGALTQTSAGRPNTAPYGFIVKVVATVAGPPALTGEDRRALYLHRDQDMLEGFPRKLGSDGESSPALADLDGDNRNELIAATADGEVHAWTRDPDTGDIAELDGWPVIGKKPGFVSAHESAPGYDSGAVDPDIGGSIIAGIAVGDANHDGVPEVYAADFEGQIYGWEPDGTLVFEAESTREFSGQPLAPFENVRIGNRNRTQRGFLGSPVLADLDQDDNGKLELVAAGLDRHVYAWNHDGTAVNGFPVLAVDETKVESVDPVTHRVAFAADSGPSLQQGPIVDTPALGDISGDSRPEIIVGTNEEYAVDKGTEGPWAVAPSTSPALNLLGPAGLLEFANGRLYAIKPDGDPDAPAEGESAFAAGWPRPIGIALAELLPLVGEGINGSPVVAELDCQSGGSGPKIGTIPAAGPAYLLNPDGTSCLGEEDGRPKVLSSEVSEGSGQVDRPVLPAVGLPAFGDLGGTQPTFVAPAAGIIRALDIALNEYQTGGQDFYAAWDPATGQMRPGYPSPVNDLSFLSGPAIGDVGGTPGEEIVAGTASMDLVALTGTGQPTSNAWPKLSSDWTIATPLLGSFGTLDTASSARRIVVNLTRSGYINAYETSASPCAPASSPRFHHDNANSGDSRRDAVLPGRPSDATLNADETGFTFQVPGDDLLCGTADSYEIRTSDSPIDEGNFDAATELAGAPDPAAPGTSQSFDFGAGTLRYVAIRARDEQGNVGRLAVVDSGDDPLPVACENLIQGTAGPDQLTGTAAGDRIKTLGGDDRAAGGDGDDCLIGGAGEDRLRGGAGTDKVRGGPDDDRLSGGKGDDAMKARGKGKDLVRCGPGTDTAKVDRKDRTKGCETVSRG
ncbi:MAG: S8 family serine peptidase [Actinomycetota bacterium]|nr:S8 family serine peptidase [Actinomycetota bacterium]